MQVRGYADAEGDLAAAHQERHPSRWLDREEEGTQMVGVYMSPTDVHWIC